MTKEAMKLVLEDYLSREMPAGTVIGDPKWWAGKIANVLTKQEQGEPVATVIEELEHDGQGWCSKVRWLYNPVPVGETLSWEQQK